MDEMIGKWIDKEAAMGCFFVVIIMLDEHVINV